MKKLLTIALILYSIGVVAQTGTTFGGLVQWAPNSLMSSTISNTIVKSKSDTTVLNKGNVSHTHEWAYKKKVISNIFCAVYHGETGCPDNWPNDFRICSGCLRHENIRTSYYSVEVPDKYEESVKKIKP